MRLIITTEDISTYRDLTSNIPTKRITPFIREAQEFDLRDLLGVELFDKVVDDISPLNYPDLDAYMIPCLSYWAYARFVKNNRATMTSNGVVFKNVDGSVQASDQAVAYLITDANNAAANYANRLIEYLNKKEADYPEWAKSCHCNRVKGAVRISAVGDTVTVNDFVKNEANKQSIRGGNGRIY